MRKEGPGPGDIKQDQRQARDQVDSGLWSSSSLFVY